jgi:hypothetical protein
VTPPPSSIKRFHSGNIQGIFREYSGNIQGTFREHSVSIQGTFREYSVTFREHPGNIQGPFRDHSGNIHLKRHEIAAWSTAEVKNALRRSSEVSNQGLQILRDVVIFGALPKGRGVTIIVTCVTITVTLRYDHSDAALRSQ